MVYHLLEVSVMLLVNDDLLGVDRCQPRARGVAIRLRRGEYIVLLLIDVQDVLNFVVVGVSFVVGNWVLVGRDLLEIDVVRCWREDAQAGQCVRLSIDLPRLVLYLKVVLGEPESSFSEPTRLVGHGY